MNRFEFCHYRSIDALICQQVDKYRCRKMMIAQILLCKYLLCYIFPKSRYRNHNDNTDPYLNKETLKKFITNGVPLVLVNAF